MTLVPLVELLKAHGISRQTYHNLLNKGLVPHYVKKFGEPGKKGARYLYDKEEFDRAFTEYVESRRRGLGIDVHRREAEREKIVSLSRPQKVQFLLDCIDPGPTETLTDYDVRIAGKRTEFDGLDEDALQKLVDAHVAMGFRPRVK